MTRTRKYLLSSERKKLCKKLAGLAFAVSLLVFVTIRGFDIHVPLYRGADLLFLPLYVFMVAASLSSTNAMSHIWASISFPIVAMTLIVMSVIGFYLPAHNSVLVTLALSAFIGALSQVIMYDEVGRADGFCAVVRAGLGFGFGFRDGFIFGFIIFGLSAVGCYLGIRLVRFLSSPFSK